MIKKILIGITVVVVLGLGYYLVSPLFIDRRIEEETPVGAMERLNDPPSQDTRESSASEKTLSTRGTFEGLVGHSAKGTAEIIQADNKFYVRFQEDFEITNGPDLYVYLGKDGQYATETELGTLKGNIGSQNYEIPENIDLSKYDEVWVWCKAFSVPFGKAELR